MSYVSPTKKHVKNNVHLSSSANKIYINKVMQKFRYVELVIRADWKSLEKKVIYAYVPLSHVKDANRGQH